MLLSVHPNSSLAGPSGEHVHRCERPLITVLSGHPRGDEAPRQDRQAGDGARGRGGRRLRPHSSGALVAVAALRSTLKTLRLVCDSLVVAALARRARLGRRGPGRGGGALSCKESEYQLNDVNAEAPNPAVASKADVHQEPDAQMEAQCHQRQQRPQQPRQRLRQAYAELEGQRGGRQHKADVLVGEDEPCEVRQRNFPVELVLGPMPDLLASTPMQPSDLQLVRTSREVERDKRAVEGPAREEVRGVHARRQEGAEDRDAHVGEGRGDPEVAVPAHGRLQRSKAQAEDA
mmetsp:Transcript_45130/g.130624  ORF Transcript_45130/g.130624 Transcript_45130/m.130624 type:complete len:290 (-) Transcript_45130:1023-1892(-)